MNKLFAAAALALVIASPALAQSYDPSVGSGNIVQRPMAPTTSAFSAYASTKLYNDLSSTKGGLVIRRSGPAPALGRPDVPKGNIW